MKYKDVSLNLIMAPVFRSYKNIRKGEKKRRPPFHFKSQELIHSTRSTPPTRPTRHHPHLHPPPATIHASTHQPTRPRPPPINHYLLPQPHLHPPALAATRHQPLTTTSSLSLSRSVLGARFFASRLHSSWSTRSSISRRLCCLQAQTSNLKLLQQSLSLTQRLTRLRLHWK